MPWITGSLYGKEMKEKREKSDIVEMCREMME
jgi:hypothetical protein